MRLTLEDGAFLVRIYRRGAGATKIAPLPAHRDTVLAVDDRYVYFRSSEVMRVAKSGGAPEVVFADPEPVYRIVVDETHVYVADRLRVARVDKDGQNWTFVSHLTSRSGMAQDAAHLCLSEGDAFVHRVPKPE